MSNAHPQPSAKKPESEAAYTRSEFMKLVKRAAHTPASKPSPKSNGK